VATLRLNDPFYTWRVTIGYLDAWRAWFSGQEVDPQARLWFMSVLWWGRAGKIAAFLGGATVILDLIGPDRLRSFPKHPRVRKVLEVPRTPLRKSTHFVRDFLGLPNIIGAILLLALMWNLKVVPTDALGWTVVVTILGLAVVYVLALIFLRVTSVAPGVLAAIFETDKPAQALRYAGLGLLFVGFHFDLLAS
jgi:hypothetical protein